MLGERLLQLRKEAQLTQDELAEILRINKHSISSYERNKSEPPDELKIAIAKYFKVSIDYLLGITDNPIPYKESGCYIRLPADTKPEIILEVNHYASYLLTKTKK